MEKPVGIAASLSDVPNAMELGRLEQLRPQELSRVQELTPASVEKARSNEAPGGKKNLSMMHYIRGPAPKDIPVPLSHSINGKSKPWEPFMPEEFAHQFHESVLQSTLQKHKGKGHAPLALQYARGTWGGRYRQILPQQVWVGSESPFPAGAQVMLMLPGWGPHLEKSYHVMPPEFSSGTSFSKARRGAFLAKIGSLSPTAERFPSVSIQTRLEISPSFRTRLHGPGEPFVTQWLC